MSISRPQKKPTHSPSFLPRIKPKDDTAIINRFGEILAKERVLNSVVCNKKHKVIIDRFGRYPHRNQILGRESTDEELTFLTQPDSSF